MAMSFCALPQELGHRVWRQAELSQPAICNHRWRGGSRFRHFRPCLRAESRSRGKRLRSGSAEELQRLRANAGAAWLVNFTLVVWIVWLYQRRSLNSGSAFRDADKQAIFTLLRQQMEEESGTLATDSRLKEDLRQEALKIVDIASRLQDNLFAADPSREGPLSQVQQSLNDMMQQVLREESIVEDRDSQLQRSFEVSKRDLREAREVQAGEPLLLVDDDVFGPVLSTASGMLAGLDIAIATQAILLAVLLAATQRAAGSDQVEAEANSAGGNAPSPVARVAEPEAKCKVFLRFYGRWDNEDRWVLLQSLPLAGVAGTVVGALRRSQSVLGPLASKTLTSLVARSARGLVRRRGWKPIVEKAMVEAGREFYLGYLVEPSSAKALKRIPLTNPGGPEVEEVPRARVLESD